MSHSYHPSFCRNKNMQKTRCFEESYNSVNENLQFRFDQVEDDHSLRIAQYPVRHFSNCQAYESSQSLHQSTLNNSTLVTANKDYFQAIERSLLLQNQNLKSHNRYLLEQVKKLFSREKAMKKVLLEHQKTIKTLHSIILDSQINLRRFFEDMVLLINELQMVNSTYKDIMVWEESKERLKAVRLQGKEETETNSRSIFESLENIKNIFSQSQIMDEKRLKLCTKSTLQHQNPEYGQQGHQQGTDNQSEQSFQLNEYNDWQSATNASDLPILCSFKNKILDLCMKISNLPQSTSPSSSIGKTQ